jgi:probable F420-dependent oxidoreductase
MHRAFRFGVVAAGVTSRERWMALARRAEELGYATLLMPDRPSMGGLAPLTALAVAATVTTTLRVGSYVFCNDLRHPALLAKEIATLDVLSGGRVEIGLGAGVSAEDFQQLGLPFGSTGERISRLEEAIHIVKGVFTGDIAVFAGRHYTLNGLKGMPRPVQQPHPPIFVGSSGRRMLAFAAREVDIIAPTLRWSAQGIDPADVSLAEKIAWIQESAGERFSQLELAQSDYGIEITDNPAGIADQGGGWQIPRRRMSIDEACTQLIARRDQLGISYIQISEGQVENFAPVVARLAGK